MRGLVLLVLLDAPEVPLYCLFVVLHQLVVHPNVVVAGGVLGTSLACLLVPLYCSFVFLQFTTINYANFIEGPSEFGMKFSHLLENFYLGFIGGLISGLNEEPHSVLRVYFQNFVDKFHRLGLEHSLVLIDVGHTL